MMLFKTDLRFDNSALTLNLQTETSVRQENTTVTTPVHCAKTLKDHLSVFAGKGIPEVYLNIIVQVNILPSTSRYVD